MYYTINEKTMEILEANEQCPDPQEEADYFNVPVYILKGERTSLSAKPSKDKRYIVAATHIQQTIPASDVGGRMITAAFLKDCIDNS